MWARPVVTAIVLLATSAMLGHVVASSAELAGPSFLYTVAREYDASAWLEGRERFPLGAKLFLQSGNKRRPLISEFAASADATVSFDGTRVLFAGKRTAADPWQIYEVPVAGGEARRVTSGTEDYIRPLYLPEDRVVYARGISGRFVIEVAPLTGGKALQLTYAPGSFLPTDVLRDGRILFEGAYPDGSGSFDGVVRGVLGWQRGGVVSL